MIDYLSLTSEEKISDVKIDELIKKYNLGKIVLEEIATTARL
jgi:hypothetical protein